MCYPSHCPKHEADEVAPIFYTPSRLVYDLHAYVQNSVYGSVIRHVWMLIVERVGGCSLPYIRREKDGIKEAVAEGLHRPNIG